MCALLSTGGHTVARLVRPPRRPGEGEVLWDPGAGTIDTAAIEQFRPDAVLHLAGESISNRWNDAQMARARQPRAFDRSSRPNAHVAWLIGRASPCALREAASTATAATARSMNPPPGRGLLAALARDWEAATRPATDAGIRTVSLRIGWVLTPQNGVLAAMLPFARLGLGGCVGDGRNFVPWVSLDDCLTAIHHAMLRDDLHGAVNIVAPDPVRSAEFARTLGSVLHRPAFWRMPAGAARIAFGAARR